MKKIALAFISPSLHNIMICLCVTSSYAQDIHQVSNYDVKVPSNFNKMVHYLQDSSRMLQEYPVHLIVTSKKLILDQSDLQAAMKSDLSEESISLSGNKQKCVDDEYFARICSALRLSNTQRSVKLDQIVYTDSAIGNGRVVNSIASFTLSNTPVGVAMQFQVINAFKGKENRIRNYRFEKQHLFCTALVLTPHGLFHGIYWVAYNRLDTLKRNELYEGLNSTPLIILPGQVKRIIGLSGYYLAGINEDGQLFIIVRYKDVWQLFLQKVDIQLQDITFDSYCNALLGMTIADKDIIKIIYFDFKSSQDIDKKYRMVTSFKSKPEHNYRLWSVQEKIYIAEEDNLSRNQTFRSIDFPIIIYKGLLDLILHPKNYEISHKDFFERVSYVLDSSPHRQYAPIICVPKILTQEVVQQISQNKKSKSRTQKRKSLNQEQIEDVSRKTHKKS